MVLMVLRLIEANLIFYLRALSTLIDDINDLQGEFMVMTETEARKLIQNIADEVRSDASNPRIKKSIHLILESFAPEHIITELLQNADDVGATFAKIELNKDGIFFIHNGEDFNEDHLKAICDIGRTTKKPGIHIGFMGIGFKAAFKISDTPYIFSGPYKFFFKRDDVFVPYWVYQVTDDVKKRIKKGFTTIFLPFRQDLPQEILEVLKETILNKLEPLCLVFLKNIEEIKILSDGVVRVLKKKREFSKGVNLSKEKISVIETKNDEEIVYSYLVFKKTLNIPEPARNDYRAKESGRAKLQTTDLTLTFNLKGDSLQPINNSVLYTFLPTPFETGLRFAINCDFLLNTQRSEPDFTSQWNLWLLESIGDMLKEVVSEFLQDEKLRLKFYDILPRRKEVQEMFLAKVAMPLIDYMKDVPCVATSEGQLARPCEVVLVAEDVQKIIPPTKAGVRYYVNPKIEGKVFLREELNVKDLTGKSEEIEFIFEVLQDEGWLSSLTADQIRNFYEILYRRIYGKERSWNLSWWELPEIEKQLKQMNIVKATNGQFFKPEETLFPGDPSEHLNKIMDLPCLIFVDPAVLSEQSRELLGRLGVRDFSDKSIVEKILDSQTKGEWRNWTENQRLMAIGFIADFIKKRNYQVDIEKTKLSNLVLPVENGWAVASDCYVPNQELKQLLPSANFVDVAIIESLTGEAKRFLNFIGVLSYPRVISLEKKSEWDAPSEIPEKKWKSYWSWLREGGYDEYSTQTPTVSVKYLDGFDKCVASQDATKLLKYLILLIEHWDHYYKFHTESSYYWFYYNPYKKGVPSYFTYQLKTYKWLPTSQGLMIPSGAFAPFREIKKVGGNFLPYLKISEQQARKAREFLQFLGIKLEVDLEMMLLVLDKLKDIEVNNILKKQLSYIYKKLANIFEDKKIEKIDKDILILDTRGNFQPSRELIWADYPEVEEIFRGELPFAWVPDNLSRPETRTLFHVLGVPAISQLIEREIIECQGMVEDSKMTNTLRLKRDYLYSALLHHKASKSEYFPIFIKKAVVVKVNTLKLRLRVLDKVHYVNSHCFCNLEEGKIYISHEAESVDIAREITKVFGAPPGTEFTISFILEQSVERISDQFRKSGIKLIPYQELETKIKELECPPSEGIVSLSRIEPLADEIKETHKSIIPPLVEEVAKKVPEAIIYMEEGDLAKEITEAKQLLAGEKTTLPEAMDVWEEKKEIEKVISEPRVIVRPVVSVSSGKNWEPQIIDGEKVFIEVGMDPAKIEVIKPSIKSFRKRMRKIVEIMGGNPDTVNICIASPETDGDRREGQLFFNILRNDNPLRWIIVAARELAYLRFPKLSQAHINLMTNLIVKVLEKIDEVYPERFRKTKTTDKYFNS